MTQEIGLVGVEATRKFVRGDVVSSALSESIMESVDWARVRAATINSLINKSMDEMEWDG